MFCFGAFSTKSLPVPRIVQLSEYVFLWGIQNIDVECAEIELSVLLSKLWGVSLLIFPQKFLNLFTFLSNYWGNTFKSLKWHLGQAMTFQEALLFQSININFQRFLTVMEKSFKAI